VKLTKAIFIILLIFLTIFFAVTFYTQNMEEVTINYFGLVDSFTAPFSTVFLTAAFLGMFIGIIIGIVGGGLTNLRLRIQLRRQTKEAEKLRKELSSFKGEGTSEPESSTFPTTSE
jgi:uncharacterized membrane protein YciS (DUF1049 family)